MDDDDDYDYEFGNSIDRDNIVATTIRPRSEEGGERRKEAKRIVNATRAERVRVASSFSGT